MRMMRLNQSIKVAAESESAAEAKSSSTQANTVNCTQHKNDERLLLK